MNKKPENTFEPYKLDRTAIANIINLWIAGLTLQNKRDNQWLEQQKNSKKPYFRLNSFNLDLIAAISQKNIALQISKSDSSEITAFAEYILPLLDSSANNYYTRSRSLNLGFPLFYFENRGRGYFITLFNIKFTELDLQGETLNLVNTQSDSGKNYNDLNISSYLWEDVFNKKSIKYDYKFTDEADLIDCVNKVAKQLGLEISDLKNKILQHHFSKTDFKTKDSEIKVVDGALIYFHQELQTNNLLIQDLKQINPDKFIANGNLAKSFLAGDNAFDEHKTNNEYLIETMSQGLASSQKEIYKNLLASKNYMVVNGPPGVGKTTLIKSLVEYAFVERCLKINSGEQIDDLAALVTSLNNIAVDNALEKEKSSLLPYYLRFGNRDILQNQTLPALNVALIHLLGSKDSSEEKLTAIKNRLKNYQSLNKNELLAIAKEFHHHNQILNFKSVDNLRLLIDEIQNDRALTSLNSAKFLNDIYNLFPVIGCTMLSAKSILPSREKSIDYVLVDEVGQSLAYQITPLLYRSKNALLIGDIYQNEPITQFSTADWLKEAEAIEIDAAIAKNKLFFPTEYNPQSSQDLAITTATKVLSLKEHYRCRPEIISFCAELCNYDLDIKTNATLTVAGISEAFAFINSDYIEKKHYNSFVNEQEAKMVVDLIAGLLRRDRALNIVVLTPFKPQQNKINEFLKLASIGVTASTIHAFQGKETDIIIFSAVKNKEKPTFLNRKKNLLNVAVSRAKHQFIFVGSLQNLNNGEYTKLLYYYIKKYGRDIAYFLKENNLFNN